MTKGDSRFKERPDGRAMAHPPRDEGGEDKNKRDGGALKRHWYSTL